ncbi:hypothetical protein B0H63DRAFT_469776 [Podospora didyma]|uniref:Uncharacterized protein n=1 Tax=Podospora didyma TaxID=330526 RepID=A0AAE0NTB7_9PEZI|nr:hypothetical protein B0H63DRAFT_469776 [Podospora didyma]
MASDCPSVEAYSSACSCIYAASDATSTETNTRFLPDATVSVFETYTTAVPTVSTGTVTSIVTITVPVAATTTVTSTLSTLTQTTTTVTSSIAAATSTSYLAIQNGPRKDRFMMRTGNVLRVDLAANQVGPGTGAQAVVAPAVGQDGELSIPGTNPPVKLFASADDDEKSALYLETEAEAAANGDKPALCSNTGGVLHCRVPSLELNQVFDCGSSGLLFSTGNPIPGSCVAVTFKVVTV